MRCAAHFAHWLGTEKIALAISTRRQRGQIVTPFLAARFGPRPVTPGVITALDLRRFTLGTNQIRSPGTVRVIAGALRCYLCFREIEGDPVGDLRASIPGAGHWRLATLPALLSAENAQGKYQRGPLRVIALADC